MTRQTFAQKLAVRVLAREGMTAIWELHVAAAEAYQRGQSSVAAILIEIADAAEREWLLCCDGMSGRASFRCGRCTERCTTHAPGLPMRGYLGTTILLISVGIICGG